MTRSDCLALLVDRILATRVDHPIRVGLDGRSAAGKSTLASELAECIASRSVQALPLSMDGFHPLGYAKRRDWSPALYYDEGYDLAGFRRDALEPLGPGGSRRCLAAKVDTLHDEAVPEEWIAVERDGVVLVDGFLLARPDLAPHFDLTLFVEVDWETMVARAAERDVAWVGDRDTVIRRYREFWIPMHRYYERRDRPREKADVSVLNEPFDAPTLVFRAG